MADSVAQSTTAIDANDDMSVLRVVREEIRAATSAATLDAYFEAMRAWLRGRWSLAEFDERAQQIVPVDLHTKFLVALVAVFDPSRGTLSRSSSTPAATTSSMSPSTTRARAAGTSLSASSTLTHNNVDESASRDAAGGESQRLGSWTDLQGRTAAGWLPDHQLIHAWALVTALADNPAPTAEGEEEPAAIASGSTSATSAVPLEAVDEEVAAIVFDHVQTSVANILEAVLKMSRSFLCTDTGFTHSYGIQKLHLSNTSGIQNPASTQSLRCILPSKTPICAEDVLDCLDLEPCPERSGGLIPHMTLKSRLIKRLENIVAVGAAAAATKPAKSATGPAAENVG